MYKTTSFFVHQSEFLEPGKPAVTKKFLECIPPLYSKSESKIILRETDPIKQGINVFVELHRIMDGNQYLLFD